MAERAEGHQEWSLAEVAAFAAVAYEGHFRNTARRPTLFAHAGRVASLVEADGGSAMEIAAAWLHDVVEDTRFTQTDIAERFGSSLSDLVGELTDPADFAAMELGERKRRQLDRLAGKTESAKRVKAADQIANVESLLDDPPLGWGWGEVMAYARGARALVSECEQAAPRLSRMFQQVFAQCEGLGASRPGIGFRGA